MIEKLGNWKERLEVEVLQEIGDYGLTGGECIWIEKWIEWNIINKLFKTKIMLGKKVRDMVTGFTGIATAECKYLNGCLQYKIESSVITESGDTKCLWTDVDRIEVIGDGLTISKTVNGGPASNMPRQSHP